MKAIFVITVELPSPEETVTVLEHLDPTEIPYFAGQVRIAVDPVAQEVLDYLDDKKATL